MAKQDQRTNAQIDRWLTKLIDQSKRNRLLNFQPSKRGTLRLTSPSADAIFGSLCTDERPQSFWVSETPLLEVTYVKFCNWLVGIFR